MAARSDAAATPGPKNGAFVSFNVVCSSQNCVSLPLIHKEITQKYIYDRQSLLEIGNTHNHQLAPATTEKLQGLCLLLKPNPETTASSTDATHTKRRRRRCVTGQKRGKRGGIRARLRANPTRPALPTLMLSNVRLLENKLDSFQLSRSMLHEARDCCVFVFTETWLNDNIPDSAIQMHGLTYERTEIQRCLCRPFYLPREFTAIVIVAVYIPPCANAKDALRELYSAISEQQTNNPDGFFIIAGDFNHANLKSVLPKFYQHVNFATRGNNTLDLVYTITDYKPLPQACDDDTTLPDALNEFYARFEMQNDTPAQKLPTPPNNQALCLSPADVRKTLSRVNPRKAAGPDNIPGRVLRDCAAQLTDVLTDIFNTSLSQAVVPTCLKSTSIIPVPKKSPVSCLNDYQPIALTPIMMKCFERLVMRNIKTSLHNTLDPLQFAYRPTRSTDDAISSTLHLALTHLENKDSYVRMLFIDFSSAFNTIIPQQLINKLNLLGLNTSLCAPQGCVLSPLLFTLLTHDCTAKFSSNHIIKFADDTTVVGLISNNDETHYREEVAQLVEWCGANNLSLNVSRTKEVVMDFRRNSVDHPPLTIDSSAVERVSSTKFLGVHITEDLTWTTNTMSLSKKAQQRLHFLRRLKRASLPPPILTTFYRGTIESVLTSCITVWYRNCSAADRKTLQRTVNTAAKIIGAPLPSLVDIFLAQCSGKATSIVKVSTHPSHHLFRLLPSGRRYRSIRARSARLLNSFFPQAVRTLNSSHLTPL
ncbi:hypothetical protein H4Q32_031236 [Labeo rohita]|uniref:Reverse transcriptase domain-containing protein n=1 Tax=Labeo rohita TaxID=84645 RepID=A0ABQ8LAD1_LABRO|nr:hypothetical protein H4Q32_031236 [Labeo rohita]